jgi:hypothetical protein
VRSSFAVYLFQTKPFNSEWVFVKMNEPLLYRPKALWASLGVCNTTGYKWIKEGRLQVVKVGGCTFITAESVKRLVEGLGTATPTGN